PEELAKTVAEGSPEQAKVVLSALAGSLDEKQAAEALARVQETSLSPLGVMLGPAEDADQRVRNALAALDYLTATRSPMFEGVAAAIKNLVLELHPLPPEEDEGEPGP